MAMEIKQMNEPVAWVNKDESGLSFKNHGGGWEPLYTHPVSQYKAITNTKIEPTVVSYTHPVKELTDEEIGDFEYQIIRACGLATANSDINPIGLRQIIKAILRKAQEK